MGDAIPDGAELSEPGELILLALAAECEMGPKESQFAEAMDRQSSSSKNFSYAPPSGLVSRRAATSVRTFSGTPE
jgi:hypothetical protein